MIKAERHSDHNRDNQTPQASVAWFEDELLGFLSSLQHGQLMPQRDDLGLHGSLATKARQKSIERH